MFRFGPELSHLERYADTFSIEALGGVVPSDWVRESIEECGRQTRRRRLLPAEFVTWLVVAAGLWREQGLRNLCARLRRGTRSGEKAPPCSAGIVRARKRLGFEPLRRLFERLTGAGAQDPAWPRWKGMALLAADSTTLRMPDTPANREAFGAHFTQGRPTSFPLVRLAVLMCAFTHRLLGAALGGVHTSEQGLVFSMLGSLPKASLLLLDRGFTNFALLWDLGRAGHHFVLRSRRDIRLRRRRRLGPCDFLAHIASSRELRRKRPDLPREGQVRVISYQVPGFRRVRLLTSLLDPEAYPLSEIVARYRDRWEVELGFGEIKTRLLGQHVPLRSQSPDLIRQEIYGMLIAYDAVRHLIALSAGPRQIDPRRLSFTDTLERLRCLHRDMATAAGERLPGLLTEFLRDLATCLLPPRRPRRYPRTVKALPCYYPIRRRGRAA